MLLDLAHAELINLPERVDRLRDTTAELERISGRTLTPGRDFSLIRPRRFDDAGGFINPGYRSCLHSHLEAVERAAELEAETLLVLEDDVAFTPRWAEVAPPVLDRLTRREWDIATLGYVRHLDDSAVDPAAVDGGWARFSGQVTGAHAYLVRRRFYPSLIDHLRAVSTGTPGDDLRGPMGPDGALNTITWILPGMIRLLAVPSLVGQRPSRSDLDTRWPDRVPGLRAVTPALRRIRATVNHS